MFEYDKEILGFISVILAASGYFQYIQSTIKGITKPHVFTWLIWTLLTGIAFFGQISDNAGAGAWVTGFSTAICASITVLAFFKGEKSNITKSDWYAFLFSLSAIPVWMITKTPFYSVIMISVIDFVSFYPTIRKTWYHPEQEALYCFFVSGLKFVLALIALENFTFITAFYISTLVFANCGFVVYALIRRRIVFPISSSLS